MATATRSRAKRDMSVLAPKAETDTAIETAVAAVNTAAEHAGASEDVARLSSERLADAGFRDAIAEHLAHKLGLFCSVVTDDEIAESFFVRGRIAASAVIAGDLLAVAAAKADFPEWDGNPDTLQGAGPELRAFGHRIAKHGVRPGAKADNLKDGQFIRSENEHRWWDCARKRWADVIKTDAQREADKAKRSARAAESRAKKKAEEEAAAKASADNMMRGNGEFSVGKTQNETFRILLNWVRQGRAAHRAAIAGKVGLDTELGSAIENIANMFEAKAEAYLD